MGVSAGNGRAGTHQLVQEVLLGEAFEHALIGAIVMDEGGRPVAVNAHACELTGYERDELVELGAAGIADDVATLPERLEALAAVATTGGATRIRHRNGSLLPVGFRTARTMAAGLPFVVVIFWEEPGASE